MKKIFIITCMLVILCFSICLPAFASKTTQSQVKEMSETTPTEQNNNEQFVHVGIQLTGIKKSETITVTLKDKIKRTRMNFYFNAENNWYSEISLPIGEYSVDSVTPNNKFLRAYAVNNPTITVSDGVMAQITLQIKEKNASFSPIQLLKNNALILFLIIGTCITLIVCKKKGVTFTKG